MSKTYYGLEAVKKVEELVGRKLSVPEIRVIEEEGFVDGEYMDDKGIVTRGVGQTGPYMDMSFEDTFKAHENIARKLIPAYDELPDLVKAELAQAAYRSDLQQSPNFRKLFNAGKYAEAAEEFLDNKDYRDSVVRNNRGEPHGVARRMEAVANAVREYGRSLEDKKLEEVPAEELNAEPAYLNKLFDSSIETVKNLFK